MKKYILNIIRNKNIVFLFILLVVILFFSLFYRNIEGFDLGSMSSSSSSSSKPIPDKYQYLAPLPEGSVWSPEFQDKFLEHLKKTNPSVTKEVLSTPYPFWGNKTLMQSASQKEAQYFLDNGMWPYDEYIVNYLTKEKNPTMSATDLENLRKGMPNRFAYVATVASGTVPQMKMLDKIFGGYNNNKAENDKYWKCVNGDLLVKDGEGGEYKSSTDYSFFPNNIPGFSFEGESCNLCAIQMTKMDGGGGHSAQDVYDSPNNNCKFKMSGEIPEAYNIYIGKYGNAPSESVPSSTNSSDSSDEYKKCMSNCEKLK